MRFESSKELYTYWLNLKGSRPAPERNEIEPSDIRKLLCDTFILEVNHQEKFVIYRLAGSRICSAYGREMKGVGYFAHWQEEDNFDVIQAVNNVYSTNVPSVLSHLGQTEQNRFIEYETLMLPLLPVDGTTTRILGISSPKKVPFWLGAEPIVTQRLRSIRGMNDVDKNDPAISELQSPPLQPDDTSFRAEFDASQHGAVKRKIGHLKLLNGGKS